MMPDPALTLNEKLEAEIARVRVLHQVYRGRCLEGASVAEQVRAISRSLAQAEVALESGSNLRIGAALQDLAGWASEPPNT